jgi:hypothetical protein
MTRACDQCIKAGWHCARLCKVSDAEGVKLAIYPLPDDLRTGKEWTEMAFWVRERGRIEKRN